MGWSAKMKMREKAWNNFSKYIRIRDAIETTGTITHARCITCGTVLPITEMDAGHAIQGRNNAILFLEEICHAQCQTCNRFSGGKKQEYKSILIEVYGSEKWQEWESMKYLRVKFTDADYEQIAKEYQEKTKAFLEKED